jgi:hypothetical protein
MRNLTILFFLSLNLIGQDGKVKPRYSCTYFAYNWQGTHNLEFGNSLLLLLKPSINKDNVGLIFAANLNYLNNSFYLTPLPKIHYRKSFRKNKNLSFHSYIGYFYTSYNSNFDNRISPELGIGYKLFHLTAKANIAISNYQDKYTLPFGLSIKLANY